MACFGFCRIVCVEYSLNSLVRAGVRRRRRLRGWLGGRHTEGLGRVDGAVDVLVPIPAAGSEPAWHGPHYCRVRIIAAVEGHELTCCACEIISADAKARGLSTALLESSDERERSRDLGMLVRTTRFYDSGVRRTFRMRSRMLMSLMNQCWLLLNIQMMS